MRKLFLFAVMFLVANSAAAQQQCICTAGCKIASDSFPPGADQPTSCAVYKGGVFLNSANVVQSNTIPLSNATVCSPASAAYVPGPAGSVACQVLIPAQAAGNVTIIMRSTNTTGTADSTPYTFQSVSSLPVLPKVPTGLRPN